MNKIQLENRVYIQPFNCDMPYEIQSNYKIDISKQVIIYFS